MLYNPKTDYPFWLRDYETKIRILESSIASMDFICDIYRPELRLSRELLDYLDANTANFDMDTKWTILKIINELQAEVTFYQNIMKESFLDDSNS